MQPNVCAPRECLGALRAKIEHGMVMSVFRRRFLPIDKLHEIMTLVAIKEAAQELSCGPAERITLEETIHEHSRTLFAMLIYNNLEDEIINFRKHGVHDGQLPLSRERAEKIVGPTFGPRLALEAQWTFLPFKFPDRMWESQLRIDDQVILPFISAEQLGAGTYGDVDKIGISPSQQNFTTQGVAEVRVVRKRLKAKSCSEDFDREAKCLLLLNRLRHPNIIPLWASYTYGEENNFLFPFIDTDLGKFLASKDRHGEFQWEFTFYSALTGLASALSKTHRLHLEKDKHGVDFDAIGYHHDLRPPNVLVSHNTFILADFGLGSLKAAAAMSQTPYKVISGDYIAPECTNMKEEAQTVNRGIDVWAFGCLIVEVVTYMVRGADGVERFRNKRLTAGRLPLFDDAGFYQPQGDVKQEVLDWIEDLRHDRPQENLVPRLLSLSLDALKAKPRERPTIHQIHHRLAAMTLAIYFDSVQELFCKVRETGNPRAPLKHHAESLRLAQKRFEAWGQSLGLGEESLSKHAYKSFDSSIKAMRDLFDILREEPGDSSSLRSFRDRIERTIKELSDSIPDHISQWANNPLHKDASERRLSTSPSRSSSNDMPHSSTADSSDTLLCEFEKVARSFQDALPDSITWDEVLKAKSIEHIYETTHELQVKNGLLDLTRIEPFLECLRSYAGVVGHIIHGSHGFLQLLWGPLAFLLQWSSSLEVAYNSVINAMACVGNELPDFQASVAIFCQNTASKEILVLFFKDILNFYIETLKPFSHPGWMHIFDRSWPKHWALISEVSSHIGRLARVMRTEIRLDYIQQEYEYRRHALELFKKQEREARQQEFSRIKTSLDLCRFNETLSKAREDRHSNTGCWLFATQTYTKWIDSAQGESRILWLTGIPGAGKTVLSSTVVDHLTSGQKRFIGFAFLTYKNERLTALSIIHFLIIQLAETHHDSDLIDVVCQSVDEVLKRDLASAANLLKSLILHAGEVYLVIDGADEISQREKSLLAIEIVRLTKSCEGLRIVLSSRQDSELLRVLEPEAVSIQVHEHNEESIDAYVNARTRYMLQNCNILQEHQREIKDLLVPISAHSKGMFLYARLIMDTVKDMYDLSEIQNELAVLPEGLDAAYQRIIDRFTKHKGRGAEKAWRLLGWIACTSSPLTVEEARQALVVRPRCPDQTYKFVKELNVVELVGPIVETVDGYIRFVHFTAKEYVTSAYLGAPLIDISRATLDLASQSIEYLCQRHHDPELTSREVSENVLTGQYSLHAFATRMWFELSCQYLRSAKPTDTLSALFESVQKLWYCRSIPDFQADAYVVSEDESVSESQNDSVGEGIPVDVREKQPLLYSMLSRVSSFRHSSFVYTGRIQQVPHKDERDPLSTSEITRRIRMVLDDDKVLCNGPFGWYESGIGCPKNCVNCAKIYHYYGSKPFKCKFPQCKLSRDGCPTRKGRDKHEWDHDNPLKCDVPGCEFEQIGFLSERMRKDHLREGHSSIPPRPTLDAEILLPDDVMPMLSLFVGEDRVGDVEKLLPTLSESRFSRIRQLRLIASSAASPAMLEILQTSWESNSRDNYERLEGSFHDHQISCVIQSIKSRNKRNMEYFLNLFGPEYISVSREIPPALIKSDWPEGMQMWCKWCRLHIRNTISRKAPLGHDHLSADAVLSNSWECIREAAKHPAGDQLVLSLWTDSGLLTQLPNIPGWATGMLKEVAASSCSTSLAGFLLDNGANINPPRAVTGVNPLQRAARNLSAKGAEMMRFLLENGADPEVAQQLYMKDKDGGLDKKKYWKKVGEERGAKRIDIHLGISWDRLVEETRQIWNQKQRSRMSSS